jgi:hypothetical protein
VLDTFRVPYTLIHNDEVRAGNLNANFDTILLASQSAASILHGSRQGERSASPARTGAPEVRTLQRPEFTGGIGLAGLANLDAFVRNGGRLIALDSAAELPIQHFPLPLRQAARDGEGAFSCPGSILRAVVESAHPLAAGMPREAHIFSTGTPAFEVTLLDEFNKGDREVKVVVRYASKDLLASGWVSGEKSVAGRPAMVEARHGKGRVVLFGFRPQFRGQTFGAFKLLLNAIYISTR